MAILEIKDLVIDYGIIRAVKGINMEVNEGSIVAILGANGAGKTTTIRSVSGVVKVKSGRILFDGENITNKDPFKIAGLGIVQSPEGRLILNGLTVEENLLVGAYSLKTTTKTITDEQGLEVQIKETRNAKIKALLEEVYGYFPILKERKKQQAFTLSGGEQQMLAIGRALMANPRLLLMDEPSMGLAPVIIDDIFMTIRRLHADGTTLLLVEKNARMALTVANRGYVLQTGRITMEGKGSDLLKDPLIKEAYLGETIKVG